MENTRKKVIMLNKDTMKLCILTKRAKKIKKFLLKIFTFTKLCVILYNIK